MAFDEAELSALRSALESGRKVTQFLGKFIELRDFGRVSNDLTISLTATQVTMMAGEFLTLKTRFKNIVGGL